MTSTKFAVVYAYRIPNGAPGGGVSGNNGLGYWDESRTIIEPPKDLEIIKRSKPEVVNEVADTLHNTPRPPCEYKIIYLKALWLYNFWYKQ